MAEVSISNLLALAHMAVFFPWQINIHEC
jgi:hypothetical protein